MKLPVSQSVDREIREIMRTVVREDELMVRITGGSSDAHWLAVWYLRDIGVLEECDPHFRLTAVGRQFERDMDKPDWWLWLTRNWFPTAVATITATAAIGNIALQLL